MKDKKIKKKIHIAIILAVIITVVIISFSLFGIILGKEDIAHRITKYGLPSLFVISIVLDMIPQIISPWITLSISIIAGIKIYFAIPIVILGSTIGSSISYIVGRKYMFVAVNLLANDKHIKQLTHLVNRYGKIIIPIAALSPLPYLPVVIGAMNMKPKNFILFGIIPRAISFIVYGLLTYFAIF